MLGNRSRVAVVAALVIAAGSLGAPAAVAHDSKGGADNPKGGADRQLAEVRKANKEFKDINVALAAGYEPAGDCVPGMGFHFVNFAQFGAMDPMVPDAVLYEADKKGRMKLVALEWFKVDADQDLSTSDDRPTDVRKGLRRTDAGPHRRHARALRPARLPMARQLGRRAGHLQSQSGVPVGKVSGTGAACPREVRP